MKQFQRLQESAVFEAVPEAADMSDQATADSGMPMESALVLTWVEELQTRITAIETAQFNLEVLRIKIMAIETAMGVISQGETNLHTHVLALDTEQQKHGQELKRQNKKVDDLYSRSKHHVERLGMKIRDNAAETNASIEQLTKRIEQLEL